MEKILAEFGVQPVLLAAQVVNFLILLFLLKKFLYKPVLKVLETRKMRIAQSLKQAEEIEKRLGEIADREEEAILRSAREGEKLIKEAGEYSAKLIDDGRKEYENLVKRGMEDSRRLAEVEKFKVMQEVKENIGGILIIALQKVTGKILTEKEKKEILEKEIKNLS